MDELLLPPCNAVCFEINQEKREYLGEVSDWQCHQEGGLSVCRELRSRFRNLIQTTTSAGIPAAGTRR